MILVDTSVWIDHLARGDSGMIFLLENSQVLTHPMVIGELALGNLEPRIEILEHVSLLRRATVANDREVLELIDRNKLYGTGIGYIDAHLLAAVRLTPGAKLWTRDKRLSRAAEAFDLAYTPR